MSTVLAIEVPKALWLTSNGRYHWADKAKRTRLLRAMGKSAAVKAGAPRFTVPVHVTATIHGRTARRVDPANAYPTVKALVDGLTDAGVWVDDDAAHVDGPDMRLGGVDPSLPAGAHRVIIVISTNDEQEVRS